MSAKEHYHTAPVVLPELPPEIWLSIFRLATWSPDMFNPQLMVSLGCDTSYREQLREFKRSLVSSNFFCFYSLRRRHLSLFFYKVTKRYLVRVCKAWYSLASPFLFEYIFLGKGRVLAPLRDGMLRSEHGVEMRESESPHSIGWRIQRLDVHMRDRTDNPELIMDILADILRRLPNLRVLTFAITGHGYYDSYEYLPENVLQATNACRDTLRLLNWYGGVKPPSNTWASFLENHPRLEAINAPVALTQLENSHIVLDSLKSIYVRCQMSASVIQDMLWNINLPSIHHAICEVIPTVPSSSHDDFLGKIGSKLTSIQINILSNNLMHYYEPFPRIVATCQNLARVDLVTFEWLIPPLFSIPNSVHTLGIRVNAHQIRRRSLEAFFLVVRNVLPRIPSVKTLCFTDQRNVRALRAHPRALSSSLTGILILGIDVMDHGGRPLVV